MDSSIAVWRRYCLATKLIWTITTFVEESAGWQGEKRAQAKYCSVDSKPSSLKAILRDVSWLTNSEASTSLSPLRVLTATVVYCFCICLLLMKKACICSMMSRSSELTKSCSRHAIHLRQRCSSTHSRSFVKATAKVSIKAKASSVLSWTVISSRLNRICTPCELKFYDYAVSVKDFESSFWFLSGHELKLLTKRSTFAQARDIFDCHLNQMFKVIGCILANAAWIDFEQKNTFEARDKKAVALLRKSRCLRHWISQFACSHNIGSLTRSVIVTLPLSNAWRRQSDIVYNKAYKNLFATSFKNSKCFALRQLEGLNYN